MNIKRNALFWILSTFINAEAMISGEHFHHIHRQNDWHMTGNKSNQVNWWETIFNSHIYIAPLFHYLMVLENISKNAIISDIIPQHIGYIHVKSWQLWMPPLHRIASIRMCQSWSAYVTFMKFLKCAVILRKCGQKHVS